MRTAIRSVQNLVGTSVRDWQVRAITRPEQSFRNVGKLTHLPPMILLP